jgi:hypothetical protein
MVVPGYENIGIVAEPCQLGQERRAQKRHVAAHYQYLICRRVHERRVETAQRSGPGDPINHHAGVPDPTSRSVTRDDQDVRCEAAQQ